MKKIFFSPVVALLLIATTLAPMSAFAFDQSAFREWLKEFKIEAIAKGVSPALVHKALDNLQPRLSVLQSDKKQPEKSLGFWEYYSRVNADRIKLGQRLAQENAVLFAEIEQEYKVQSRFLLALWGLESHFGRIKGNIPLVQSLATLAQDSRRGAFFRSELLHLLQILDDDHFTLEEAVGSWAGAFGHTQFMPSTHKTFGLDADNDGKIHLIASKVDALYSAAHYLHRLGWDHNKTWGREVTLPKDFDFSLARFESTKPLNFWQSQGIRTISGAPLPSVALEASLILPVGMDGPAFLVYENFRRIMRWNNSIFFALNVSLLSDAIARRGVLFKQKPEGYSPLKTQEILQIQSALNSLGFDTGTPDGVIGRQTRGALRDFQIHYNLPADSFPSSITRKKLKELTG